MPEAITKYAVNSTLGTENFKPLDQIIIGQKYLVGSTSTPIVSLGSHNVSRDTTKILGYFTPKLDGTVSISALIRTNGTYGTVVSINLGNTPAIQTSTNITTKLSGTVNVTKHTRYEIKLITSSDGAFFDDINIGAVVMDMNETFLFEGV